MQAPLASIPALHRMIQTPLWLSLLSGAGDAARDSTRTGWRRQVLLTVTRDVVIRSAMTCLVPMQACFAVLPCHGFMKASDACRT